MAKTTKIDKTKGFRQSIIRAQTAYLGEIHTAAVDLLAVLTPISEAEERAALKLAEAVGVPKNLYPTVAKLDARGA
jgi:hypothetical protein